VVVEYKQPVKTRFPIVEDWGIMLNWLCQEELCSMELDNQMCKGSKYQIDEPYVLSS
jgi:hypothetical protein